MEPMHRKHGAWKLRSARAVRDAGPASD